MALSSVLEIIESKRREEQGGKDGSLWEGGERGGEGGLGRVHRERERARARAERVRERKREKS